MGQAGNALNVVGRALAIAETAPSKALFVQCLRVLPDPPDVEELRPGYGRCRSPGDAPTTWRRPPRAWSSATAPSRAA
jgi:hypothetical protein